MKDRRFAIVLALLVAVFLMAGSLFSMQRAQPAAAAIPTPVGQQAGGGDWVMVNYSDSTSEWANAYDTATSGSKHAPAYTAADISWTIVVSGTIYVTCTLEFSNDNSNWADGVNILNNVSADETNMDQFELFGRYHRIKCTESSGAENENTVTYTIKSKLMN
jgi:hypothetical protein